MEEEDGRRRRSRHRPKKRRVSAEPKEDPLADPARPIPNLACADAFEHYYYTQQLVEPGWEWSRFINTLHQPLPITFRVQPAGPLGDECRQSLAELYAREPGRLPELTPLHWCSSWAIHISKEALKASYDPALVTLQAWIAKWAALGALSRQAIESMVPVALLRVQPHHACLDMCASPGSKTTQALEALYDNSSSGAQAEASAAAPRGFMVANDMSPARCQMLMRRCAALGELSERLVVTCHPAQSMPRLPPTVGSSDVGDVPGGAGAGRYPDGCYDRIICDVPCSGDGTTRKNPSIWHRWTVEYALEMHRLQLQIAMRAAALVRVGGLVCYSTCSLNPLENESVVAELLKRTHGALELVDCSDRLPELKRAKGLSTWTVLDDDMVQHESYAELLKHPHLPNAIKRRFMPSMWPPQAGHGGVGADAAPPLRLERCLRLLPHLANMGGFFVALIRKVAPLPGPTPRGPPNPSPIPPPSSELPSARVADVAPPPALHRRSTLRLVPPDVLSTLAEQLGLKRSGVHEALGAQLVCASDRAACLSRIANELLPICMPASATLPGPSRSLRVHSAGCVLARRSRGGSFQLTVEGARAVGPFAKSCRRLRLCAADALLLIHRAGSHAKSRRPMPLAELSDKAAEKARELPTGPCLLLLQPPDKSKPALMMPARRLREPERLRLLLRYTAGLEFRPTAILHSVRAYLESEQGQGEV